MKTYKQFITEISKVTLYTHPDTTGADVSDTNSNANHIKDIPLHKLHPNEPKSKMKQPGSSQIHHKLIGAIKSGSTIPPIKVIPHPNIQGHYLVVDGHHRFFASQTAGKRTIRAHIIPSKNVTVDSNRWGE